MDGVPWRVPMEWVPSRGTLTGSPLKDSPRWAPGVVPLWVPKTGFPGEVSLWGPLYVVL